MGMVPEVCAPMRGRLASDRDPDVRVVPCEENP